MAKEILKPKKNKSIATYLVLFFVAFLLYSNTIPHDYAWDDKIVIDKNPRVQEGIKGIPQLFVKNNSKFQYDKYGYRPITLMSFAIDYDLTKDAKTKKGNPSFSHFMNAFYYGILCVLIFIFLTALFKDYHPAFAWLITILFIAHPLHVEVVANIKSRDEIFGFLFAMISFIYFLKYFEQKKVSYILYSFFAYLLAFLSKENAITVLGIFPLILFIKRIRPSKKQWIISAAGLFLLTAVSLVIYYLSSHSTAGVESSMGKGIYEENGILGNSFFHLSGIARKLPNAVHVLGLYLKNFIIPYPLVFYYGENVIPVTGWGNVVVIISLLVHAGLLVLGIKYFKKRPEILFGFLFYAITISIYTHLFRTLSDTMADRFLFFGSLGLSILLLGLVGLVFKINWKPVLDKKGIADLSLKNFINLKKPALYGFMLLVLVFSGLTIVRNGVWKNDLTLVTHDLPYLENCSRCHYYYASLLNKQMVDDPTLVNNLPKKQKIEMEMVKQYRRSMELSKYAYLSYLELGTYYCREFRYDEGIPILKKGAELFPEAPDLSFYLGQTYVLIDKSELAVPYLEKSVQSSYNQATNYYFLSLAYSKTGRHEDALRVVDEGMKKFDKDKGMFYDALGFIYFDHKDLDKSIEATFKLADYGKPLKDVYSYVIGRCFALGNTAKGNFYKEEARLKGIVFQ